MRVPCSERRNDAGAVFDDDSAGDGTVAPFIQNRRNKLLGAAAGANPGDLPTQSW
jgi:hypothetical protein